MITGKNLISFGSGNAKLNKRIATFSIPAGYSCPQANLCLSKVDPSTGQLMDGPNCQYRCFSASAEIRPNVRSSRWNNFNLLLGAKSTEAMANLIQASLPSESIVRIHVSGDFFSLDYFQAWLTVARNTPQKTFYAYTKSLNFWVRHRSEIPKNFRLVASFGGKLDEMISRYNLPSAKVVFSVEEARSKGLEIDHDDSLAIEASKPFALLLHGTQPVETAAAKAWSLIKRTIGGYSKNHKRVS